MPRPPPQKETTYTNWCPSACQKLGRGSLAARGPQGLALMSLFVSLSRKSRPALSQTKASSPMHTRLLEFTGSGPDHAHNWSQFEMKFARGQNGSPRCPCPLHLSAGSFWNIASYPSCSPEIPAEIRSLMHLLIFILKITLFYCYYNIEKLIFLEAYLENSDKQESKNYLSEPHVCTVHTCCFAFLYLFKL